LEEFYGGQDWRPEVQAITVGQTVRGTMKGRSVIFKGRYIALRFNKLLELLPFHFATTEGRGLS